MALQDLNYLYKRFKEGTATPGELRAFYDLVGQPENEAVIEALVQKDLEELSKKSDDEVRVSFTRQRLEVLQKQRQEKLRKIFETPGEAPVVPMERPVRRVSIRWAAAAAVVLVAGALWLTLNSKPQTPNSKPQTAVVHDIAPGHDGAILTLSNGRKIILDSANNGALASEQGTNITKDNGQVVYNSLTIDHSPLTIYNTMTTPRGRQYQLVLSDGTKVWLNAASSIKYPTAFTTNERRVEITGEAYFEVAHDASKPFIVSKGQTEVQVLGTHFNVNAYDDENDIRVTLLQGSVKVSRLTSHDSRIIKPGEQVILNLSTPQHLNITRPDLDQVMAWKNGMFNYESADLPTILRQFSRWYDVDVIYEGAVPKDKFFVLMKRDVPLSSVLKALQASNVKFKIEGKKLMVQAG